MPNCPKCESLCPEGSAVCSGCGEPLDGARQDKESQATGPVSGGSAQTISLAGVVSRYWAAIVSGILLLVMYSEFTGFLWNQWNLDYGYYSHGPLVPLIAGFMVWSNRKRMALIKIRSSWLGLLLILPCLPVFVFGRWTSSSALVSLTFLPILVGTVLMLTGPNMTRLLLFPILFLFFMIPLPATLLDSATFKVQMMSTTLAAKILSLTYDVSQSGATIESTDLPEPLIVGAPCSGFRLLISLLTFTAFFVYMVQARPWKKALMVLLAFPLSLFINSLRITMIGYAGIWTGSADAMHKFHDWSGYLNLIICFVILFGFARLLKADKFGIPDPDAALVKRSLEEGEAPPRVYGGVRRLVAVAILALVVVSNVLITPLKLHAKGRLDRNAISSAFGNWTSFEVPIDEQSKKMLKTGDMMQRVYTDHQSGKQVVVFVSAARDSDAFHDPHACLPGGGSPIAQDRIITLDIDKPKPMKIRATLLQASSPYGASIVLYWYMYGSETYPTTPAMRQRMRALQLRNFANIVLHPGRGASVEKQMDQGQWHWYRFSTDIWQDADTDLKELEAFIRDYVANVRGFGEDVGG